MVDVVIPGNLGVQFDIGGAVPNKITIPSAAFAQSGAGAPVGAPTPEESPWYVDTSTTPQNVYFYSGGAWNLTGDGAGGGADGNDFVNSVTFDGVTNILTLAGTGGAGGTVDLSALAGGGGGADGNISNVVLNGTDLEFTGVNGGFNGNVDLSSLGGGGGGGLVNTVTGTAPIQVTGTAADRTVAIDIAALVTALCGNADMQDCIKSAALGLIRDDGDGTFTAAHATDGAGNYVYNDCP